MKALSGNHGFYQLNTVGLRANARTEHEPAFPLQSGNAGDLILDLRSGAEDQRAII